MKKFLSLLAVGAVSLGAIESAEAQAPVSRHTRTGGIVLDDNMGNTITLVTPPGPITSGSFVFPNPGVSSGDLLTSDYSPIWNVTAIGQTFTGFDVTPTLTHTSGPFAGLTQRGIAIALTNGGGGAQTPATNIAALFSATGGTSANYGLLVSNGNVGIGNTTPTQLFSVGATEQFKVSSAGLVSTTSAAQVTGEATLAGDAAATSLRIKTTDGTGWDGFAAFGGSDDAVVMGEIGSRASLGAHTGALGAWADLYINEGGGNVRIGSQTAPTRVLDVAGSFGNTGAATLGDGDDNVSINAGTGTFELTSAGLKATTAGLVTATYTDGSTNSAPNILEIEHATSATAAVGFGAGINLQLEESAGGMEDAALIRTTWTNATNLAEASNLEFYTRNAGGGVAANMTLGGTGNLSTTGSITAATGLTATAGGATVTGTTAINNSGTATTQIGNTGAAFGNVTIGNTTGATGDVAINASTGGTITLGGLDNSANPTHVATLTAGGVVASTAIADFGDNWINNQTGTQASANFNIDGDGTIGDDLTVGDGSATTGLTIDNAGAANLVITEAALTRGGTIAINPGAANTVTTNGGIAVSRTLTASGTGVAATVTGSAAFAPVGLSANVSGSTGANTGLDLTVTNSGAGGAAYGANLTVTGPGASPRGYYANVSAGATNTGAQLEAVSAGGTTATGLIVSATGAGTNVAIVATGGIDNNTGGITEAGAISGATAFTSLGAMNVNATGTAVTNIGNTTDGGDITIFADNSTTVGDIDITAANVTINSTDGTDITGDLDVSGTFSSTSLTAPNIYGGSAAATTLNLEGSSNAAPGADAVTITATNGVQVTVNATSTTIANALVANGAATIGSGNDVISINAGTGTFELASSQLNIGSNGDITDAGGAVTFADANGVTISAGGANITGSIDNNTGGITEAGAITGGTGYTGSGTVSSTISSAGSAGFYTAVTGSATNTNATTGGNTGAIGINGLAVVTNGGDDPAIGGNFSAVGAASAQAIGGRFNAGSGSANIAVLAETGDVRIAALTASRPVLSDGDKDLVSGQIDLANTNHVTGILGAANGGTANGFTAFTGPTTATKTFTLPDATATILTDNADVTIAQGGTGTGTAPTPGGVIFGSSATAYGSTAAGTTGQILQSAGAGTPTWSTAVYPATTTVNQLLYSSAANSVSGLATAVNGVLVTDGTGVPSISNDLPDATQDNITRTGTIVSGTWNGTDIAVADGGTGASSHVLNAVVYGNAGNALLNTGASTVAGQFLQTTTAGAAPTWATVLDETNGGTGVANASGETITLGGTIVTAGDFATSGANSLTLTTTGATNVTLPTSGTLATTTNTVLYDQAGAQSGSTTPANFLFNVAYGAVNATTAGARIESNSGTAGTAAGLEVVANGETGATALTLNASTNTGNALEIVASDGTLTTSSAITTTGNITTTGIGTITAAAGLTVSANGASITGASTLQGGQVDINPTAGNVTNINNGAGASNVNIGGNSNDVVINGADFDVTAAGAVDATSLTLDNALAVAEGGTGVDASGATDGQLLIGDAGVGFVLAALTATTNETEITNGAGSITLGLADAITVTTSLTAPALTGSTSVTTPSITNAAAIAVAPSNNAGGAGYGVNITGGASSNAASAGGAVTIIGGAPGAGGATGDVVLGSATSDVRISGTLAGVGAGNSVTPSNKFAEVYTLTGGGASEVITNSNVTTSSVVVATMQSGAVIVHRVVPGSGNFTVHFSAAPAASDKIMYIVIN